MSCKSERKTHVHTDKRSEKNAQVCIYQHSIKNLQAFLSSFLANYRSNLLFTHKSHKGSN